MKVDDQKSELTRAVRQLYRRKRGNDAVREQYRKLNERNAERARAYGLEVRKRNVKTNNEGGR
jgi:hypothetical protein